ncbi:uncharacterized protein LOC115231641 [Octopus sinensis]|uniref:Uncharacterized protein LOC115231641 n=1 Tax=Octopus sinensis TaxID=2607531 RepID=A0A6P7U0F5_9MOLL|nr:uncharacterized protein LOC115231641 [Octopus sinensis]
MCQKHKEEISILGIDLSRAFDAINRKKLMHVLEGILDGDALRMIRFLLANTSLSVRVGNYTSMKFKTDTGVPQGDSLSPVLFIIYLEAALRPLRRNKCFTNVMEVIYADDIDFVSRDQDSLENLLKVIPHSLKDWSLVINPDKTERTTISRLGTRNEEKWRTCKKVGSLLVDSEDVIRRKVLAVASFKKMWTIWMRRKYIGTRLRIRLYNSFVEPILLYNAGTWGLTAKELEQLNSFHRKQLRLLLGIHWPKKMTNNELYRITHTSEIAKKVTSMKWMLFGHVLRASEMTPANQNMESYFCSLNKTAYRGRQRTTLPTTLDHDLTSIGRKLKSADDLYELRYLARNRGAWIRLTERILSRMAKVES